MIVSQRLSLRTPANFMESHAEPEDLLNIPWRHPDKIGRDTILHELRAICRFDAGRVLDVGSGDTGYRDLFEQRFKSFVTLDLKHAARPNVAGSAMALPFRSESFDTIISTCMLEHVP